MSACVTCRDSESGPRCRKPTRSSKSHASPGVNQRRLLQPHTWNGPSGTRRLPARVAAKSSAGEHRRVPVPSAPSRRPAWTTRRSANTVPQPELAARAAAEAGRISSAASARGDDEADTVAGDDTDTVGGSDADVDAEGCVECDAVAGGVACVHALGGVGVDELGDDDAGMGTSVAPLINPSPCRTSAPEPRRAASELFCAVAGAASLTISCSESRGTCHSSRHVAKAAATASIERRQHGSIVAAALVGAASSAMVRRF
jgi:hypothetical protein